MKISTKGRYGLRALVDLAVNVSGQPVPLTAIAARQRMSVNYLEQVFGRTACLLEEKTLNDLIKKEADPDKAGKQVHAETDA